ncbi:MAG: choice-of-anchor X domain-containing protein [Pyrinomonadaceae bacterium]
MAHGILSNGGAWNKPSFSWVNKLNSLGIPNSNRLNMGNLDSIQDNARKIATEVANATQRWGVDKVDLVGHSKGGIDSRHFVENNDSVERVIQLGTPNGGTRLADVGQGIVVFFGGLPGFLISAFAGPAGVQLTRPYMGIYNATHGPNPKVKYTALAGDYDPDCFFLNPFCRPLDRLLLLISGTGDTIVPVSSVHALGYTENRRFRSSGGNGEAKHTQLNGSSGVYNSVRDRVEIFGTNALALAAEEETTSLVRTAAAAATIRQGEVQSKTIPIDQATPIFFSMMYPSGNLDMALISPSGQRFDATTVAGRTDVSHDEGDIEGGRLEVYNFGAPETGMWTVEVSAPSVTDPSGQVGYAVSGWLENPAITFVGKVEQPSVHAGETLRFSGTVKNGDAPLTGASVMARVALPDSTLRDVSLRDDGADGDATANDGVYTGVLSNTAQPGTYRIAFNASRSAAPAFSREDFTIATVSRSASTISGPFQDSGLDTDGDGLFNQLVVQVGVNATVAGNYRLLGVVTDSAGNTHNASVLMALNVGQQTVPLRFDGESIFKNRVDGPYRLTSVVLSEEDDLNILPVDDRVNVHQTAAYSYRQFQHSAINLTGNGSTTGIDTDGNDLFNLLRVGVEVEIINPGFYRWSARLTDRNGTELGFAAGSRSFTAGLNIMNLTYDGERIGRNGVDGPYFIRGLIVFGAGESLVASDAFTTSALRANQFEGFTTTNADVSVTQIASPNPVLTGSEVTYTTTVTNLGPGTAESLTVTDNLPANTTFVSCDATGGAICGGAGNARFVTINSLAAGASINITLVATVECSLADGTTISNTATATSSTPDLSLDNNSTTASVLASNPPPVISGASVDIPVLWPPNHQMVDVTVSYDVTDNCGATTTKLNVTRNEPVDGDGDGDTSPDWEVVDGHHVRLRAERSGNGDGRIYTITITATDSAGGSSTQTVTVTVPHNRGMSVAKETSL